MKVKPTSDPFPNLPRRLLYVEALEQAVERRAALRPRAKVAPPKSKPAAGAASGKVGRPRKVEGEPWAALGMSRAQWYREQAKRRGDTP
jgi:hypothetical protein